VIVVKENVCENGPDGTAVSVLDEEDSSLTRLVDEGHWCLFRSENTITDRCHLYLNYCSPDLFTPCFNSVLIRNYTIPRNRRSNKMWEEIFQQAGLKIVKEEVQLGLPQGLFMVKSWALR
jgi:hypothetical protein